MNDSEKLAQLNKKCARPTQFSLIYDFYSSDQDFAIDFFQIPLHNGHPCHSLTVRHYQALYGTVAAYARHTKK